MAEADTNAESILAAYSDFTLPSAKIRLGNSTIPTAGRGLFATKTIACGEEVFHSEPILMMSMVSDIESVCDWCHIRALDTYRLLSNTTALPSFQIKVLIKLCNGCHQVRFCSKVSTS